MSNPQQTNPESPAPDLSMSTPMPVPPPLPAPMPPAGARPRPVVRATAEDKPFARGFGIGMGVALGAGIVGLALTLVSVLGLASSALLMGGRSLPDTTSHVWGPTNASTTMLALNISGAIDGAGGTMFATGTFGYEIADQLDALESDDYAGVVLLMDTPGGSIYGSKAIAEAVVRYQERTGKKVVAYVQSMSASGGMYAMAPADLIISDYGTMVGSIGVIFGPFERYRDVTGLTGDILTSGVLTTGGITVEYLTQGTGKDFGNPFRDMTELERSVYTRGLEVEYAQFVDFVAEHRQISADTIRNDLGAFMFDPTTAIEKGLVDQIAGRPDAFRAAAELNGVDPEDTKVVSPAMPSGFAQLLGAQARIPGHNVPLSTTEGSTPTSQICVGAPTLLAFAGDFTTVCGD